MKEVDWDNPDEVVVDFEDIEEVAMLPDGDSDDDEEDVPTKKEPIKPKATLDIESFKNRSQQISSREEDRKLLVELMFVGEQLKGNLYELQKLDGIAARAAALNEIDTQKIMDRLNSVSFTQIERKIVDTIREDLSKTRDEILTAAGEAEAAAKELTQKTELLKESSDSMLQIDNMADNLEEVSKNIKSWRIKNMYAAIGLSLFFGISATAIVSNIGSLFTSTESIQNAQILTPKFGKIAVLPHKTDPSIFYLAFGSKELTRVETMEKNEIKYIVIHSQK